MELAEHNQYHRCRDYRYMVGYTHTQNDTHIHLDNTGLSLTRDADMEISSVRAGDEKGQRRDQQLNCLMK